MEAPAPISPPDPGWGNQSNPRSSGIQHPWRRKMRPATREEERLTEDEIARTKLGPRGVPGGQDTAKMTPQEGKKIPRTGHFNGHTA